MKGSRSQSHLIAELRKDLAERDRDLLTYRAELESANRRLESLMQVLNQELQGLAKLQAALVPTTIPVMPGFEVSSKFVPGEKRGGDYFDLFEHEDKLRFGIILSHCSGYMASALFMSVLLRLTSQMEARRLQSPHLILEKIRSELLSQFSDKEEAHLFYAAVDRRNLEMDFAAIGDHVILIHHKGLLQRLTGDRSAISKSEAQTPLSSQRITLHPQDQIIMCSPGCVNATNGLGERLGEERLFRMVTAALDRPVHELRNEILFQVQRFSEKQSPEQDQTVLVVQVRERIIRLSPAE